MTAPVWYVRDPSVVALARDEEFVFFARGRTPLVLEDTEVDDLADVLDACAVPVPAEALGELCTDESLALLVDEGVLLRGAEAELRERVPRRVRADGPRPCKRIVVGVGGAVASIGALEHILALAGHVADEVDVVLTRAARRFVRRQVFEYHGVRVWTDAFAPRAGAGVPHMHLATGADLVLLAPASAGTLARLASGACSDLLSLVVAATRAPVVIAPAMNGAMWRHPAVARNVAQLRADGMWIVEPRVGFEIADRNEEGALGAMGFTAGDVGALVAVVLDRARRA
jgi:3-polyprenyl-4-hydroxybenzoate decarboxylase